MAKWKVVVRQQFFNPAKGRHDYEVLNRKVFKTEEEADEFYTAEKNMARFMGGGYYVTAPVKVG